MGPLLELHNSNASLLSPISLQIKVLTAIIKRLLTASLYTLFEDYDKIQQLAECFESAVTDIIGFFSLKSPVTEHADHIKELQSY